MKKKTLVDESILDDIPDELIRPLLAISIRASHPHTIENYKQLLKEIRRLSEPCGRAGEASLYYLRVENKVEQELHAMIDAQKWVRKTEPAAEATSIEVNRWSVNVHSNGRNRRLLVAYRTAGMDVHGLRVRAVVTEASESDV